MFKTSVRKSVSLAIVAVIMLSSALLTGCQPYPYNTGINIEWDFSYLLGHCDFSGIPSPYDPFPMVWYMQPDEFSGTPTVGEFIDGLVSALSDPEAPCSGVPTHVALFMRDSNGVTTRLPDDMSLSSLQDVSEDIYLYFGPVSTNGEVIRLTLFGYSLGDGKSCVLWSLDGSHPVNVDKTCGGSAELVCTVKLVDKELKYDCQDGYDWLGFNIVHDSQWQSWADKFASKNGRP